MRCNWDRGQTLLMKSEHGPQVFMCSCFLVAGGAGDGKAIPVMASRHVCLFSLSLSLLALSAPSPAAVSPHTLLSLPLLLSLSLSLSRLVMYSQCNTQSDCPSPSPRGPPRSCTSSARASCCAVGAPPRAARRASGSGPRGPAGARPSIWSRCCGGAVGSE